MKYAFQGVVWWRFIARLRFYLSPVWLGRNPNENKGELKVNCPSRKPSRVFCQFLSVVVVWEVFAYMRRHVACRFYPLEVFIKESRVFKLCILIKFNVLAF